MVAALRRDRLTVTEIDEIAVPLLARLLGNFGFAGVETTEDRDFGGEPIIRMTARVQARPSAKMVIDSLDAVRTELLRVGEERFVIFHTRTPDVDDAHRSDVDADANW